jgi:hypothetical protein
MALTYQRAFHNQGTATLTLILSRMPRLVFRGDDGHFSVVMRTELIGLRRLEHPAPTGSAPAVYVLDASLRRRWPADRELPIYGVAFGVRGAFSEVPPGSEQQQQPSRFVLSPGGLRPSPEVAAQVAGCFGAFPALSRESAANYDLARLFMVVGTLEPSLAPIGCLRPLTDPAEFRFDVSERGPYDLDVALGPAAIQLKYRHVCMSMVYRRAWEGRRLSDLMPFLSVYYDRLLSLLPDNARQDTFASGRRPPSALSPFFVPGPAGFREAPLRSASPASPAGAPTRRRPREAMAVAQPAAEPAATTPAKRPRGGGSPRAGGFTDASAGLPDEGGAEVTELVARVLPGGEVRSSIEAEQREMHGLQLRRSRLMRLVALRLIEYFLRSRQQQRQEQQLAELKQRIAVAVDSLRTCCQRIAFLRRATGQSVFDLMQAVERLCGVRFEE